jgi:hypothetical protein
VSLPVSTQPEWPVSEEMQLSFGAAVACTDGPGGTVIRVVVDPVARAATHIVVEPTHRRGLGRLVPLDAVVTAPGGATPDTVRLRCTVAELDGFDRAEEMQFVPGSNGGYGGFPPGTAIAWPYYRLGTPLGAAGQVGAGVEPVIHDTVPLGEVGVRRGEAVHATDGDIGRVRGLVVAPGDHAVSHVLLEEGHLWGRKEVAIPIRAVTRIAADGIHLDLARSEIGDLPPVGVDDPDR